MKARYDLRLLWIGMIVCMIFGDWVTVEKWWAALLLMFIYCICWIMDYLFSL